MKKIREITSLFLVLLLILSLAACGNNTAMLDDTPHDQQATDPSVNINDSSHDQQATDPSGNANDSSYDQQPTEPSVSILPSPDKYTWYIKDYVGKNCASIGYTSWGGDRRDTYGEGTLELIFITPDGTYIDPESEDDLKQYVITGQNIEPNTELKLTFEKDSEGNEYDNLVASQTYDEIVLSVKKVNSSDNSAATPTAINPSPDKYTWYIVDYVGRNLANCGYTSWGGDYLDAYGEATVKLIIVSEDGAFVDPEDADALRGYVVTGQSVAPNFELELVFSKDSEGVESDIFVESQNVEEIELTVRPIGVGE